jgi:hypothetical protein
VRSVATDAKVGRSSSGTRRGNTRRHFLSKAFLLNLGEVWKSEFPPPPGLSQKFLRDLQDAYEADGRDDPSPWELEDLEARLDKWAAACEERLQNTWKRLHPDHPMNCPISLFGTMDFGRLEVAHTRTLAWLLDPRKEHGFGNALVKLLLREVHARGQRTAFYPDLVQAERFYRNSAEEDAGRTDVWVRGLWGESASPKPGLVVIEAKIDASEGAAQLARYNSEIARWQQEHNISSENICRIFLTRDGAEGSTAENWKSLSFSQLAWALCEAANSLRNRPGFHYLRLYIAGVLKDILRLPIGKPPIRGEPGRYRLLAFLEKG